MTPLSIELRPSIVTHPRKTSPLRDRQKKAIEETIKKSARDLLYTKPYHEVSVAEIAKMSGISRTAVYLHYPKKSDIISSFLEDDLENHLKLYRILAAQESIDTPFVRSWLQKLWCVLDERRNSQFLFSVLSQDGADYDRILMNYRDEIISILGARFSFFRHDGADPDGVQRHRARCYQMIFVIEQGIAVFGVLAGSPDRDIGLDELAKTFHHTLTQGELCIG